MKNTLGLNAIVLLLISCTNAKKESNTAHQSTDVTK